MPTVPPTEGVIKNFDLTLITDNAFKNLSSRYSQGAYCILLTAVDSEDSVGGLSHVLEFNSRKSRRVVKSTWGAEMHSLLTGLERLERIYYWLKEIYQGFKATPGIDRIKSNEYTTVLSHLS